MRSERRHAGRGNGTQIMVSSGCVPHHMKSQQRFHHGPPRLDLVGQGRCLLSHLSCQKNSAATAARTTTTNRRSNADCSSHAIAGTPTPSMTPTRQMRHAVIWMPAVKVPSANTVSAASALASAFIIRLTSATNMRCIAKSTAPQCRACVHSRRRRCSLLEASRQHVMTQITPRKGARTIQ